MSQQINLYEARLRPRHELAVARNLGIAALALLLLMTGLALWSRLEASRAAAAAEQSQKALAGAQEQLTVLSRTVAQRKVSPALAAELELAKSGLAVREEVMAVLDSGKLGNTAGFSSFMTGFARLSQSDLWLTGFSLTLGGEAVEIRGRALDAARLPAYVQRLSGEKVFRGRRFAALEIHSVDPADEKAELPRTAPPQGAQAVASLPRYVEFVLRSEQVAVPAGEGGKP